MAEVDTDPDPPKNAQNEAGSGDTLRDVPFPAQPNPAVWGASERICPRCSLVYVRPRDQCAFDGEPLRPAHQDPWVGRTLDRYEVREKIGDGGMGRVYRAEHRFLKQGCAIKVPFGDHVSDQTWAVRFRREARAASQIRHPNVVPVLDFGETAAGVPFMVMELVHGQTLESLLANKRILPPVLTGAFAKQIALGLGAVHAGGFVHRDLKPANVMVTGSTARIMDFGLVRASEKAADEPSQVTITGQVFGTPAFMAPEQIDGRRTVDERTDLYSLGVIMYCMLAGDVPFKGGLVRVLEQHLNQAPPPLVAAGGLEELTLWLLKKDPNARAQSAQEVVTAIESLRLEMISSGPALSKPGGVPAVDPAETPRRVDPPEAPTEPPLPPTFVSKPNPLHMRTASVEQRALVPEKTRPGGWMMLSIGLGAAVLAALGSFVVLTYFLD